MTWKESTMHRILIEPTGRGRKGDLYRVKLGEETLLTNAREPLLEACRILARRGLTGRLEMWRSDKSHPDMVADIAKAQHFTVLETPDEGPKFIDLKRPGADRPWNAVSRRDVFAMTAVSMSGVSGPQDQKSDAPQNTIVAPYAQHCARRAAMIASGAQIRAARALLGWSRRDLAKAAGLHPNAVAYWERHKIIQGASSRFLPFACERILRAFRIMGVVMVEKPGLGVALLSSETGLSSAEIRCAFEPISAQLAR
jgi:hypothetical protein